MLGFIYDRHAPVPTDALYRFCRDEALNYDYIVAGMGGKPRKKGKAPLFFKRMRRGANAKTRLSGVRRRGRVVPQN